MKKILLGVLACLASFEPSAEAAYCSASAISSWSCGNCKNSGLSLSSVSVQSYGGSQSFIGYNSAANKIILSFRGSSNIPNWINNIDTVKTTYPYCSGCYVHAGFYKAWLDIIAQVRSGVTAMRSKYPTASLRIYGHSLGAALAVHAAGDLAFQYSIYPEFVYTFGQPRVGEKNFATWYNSMIKYHYRVTHGHDIVPHVPPQALGFWHTNLEIFYPGNPPTYQTCNTSGEDPSCSNQYTLDLSITDHLTYMGGTCCCPNGESCESTEAEVLDQLEETKLQLEKSLSPTNTSLESESGSACDYIKDCGTCISKTDLGAHVCEWCTYQYACHDVGSIYNPCPSTGCVSLASLASCSMTKCP